MDNPTRKQFLTYLESLDPKEISTLIRIIKSIHKYKLSFAEYNNLLKMMEDHNEEINESTVMKESELLYKMKANSSGIIWHLYNLYQQAQSGPDVNEENSKFEGHLENDASKEISSKENENGEFIEDGKIDFGSEGRQHLDTLYQNIADIDVDQIVVEQSFKVNQFREVPHHLQIVLL